jgi:prepilin-type N-terminal cleavage/methylation domain-containing protein
MTDWKYKKYKLKESGMTLIEVLVAVALIAIIGAAVMMGLGTTSKVLIATDERSTAESLARSAMEEIKMQLYIHADEGGEATYDVSIGAPGYSICSVSFEGGTQTVEEIRGVPWSINLEDPELSGPSASDNGLQRVELVIKHEDREIFRLADFKVDY